MGRKLIIVFVLLVFASTGVVLATPAPLVTLNIPPTPALGEAFTFTASFDNSGTSTGYGPFVDLVLPAAGIDGDDGISFIDATYLGQPVEAIRRVFGAGGCVNHPFLVDDTNTPLEVCGRPGDELIVLLLPFGSYTPAQPAVEVEINAQVSLNADVSAPLGIYGRGGFRFGADPLNNPCCDAPVVSPVSPDSGTWTNAPTTPVILRPSKGYLGPADETEAGFIDIPDEAITGPNGNDGPTPLQYEITVDVADGQQITNVSLTDILPAGMLFDEIISVVPAGSTPGVGAVVPNNADLTLTWGAPITGTTAGDEIRVVLQVTMADVTTNGAPVGITNAYDIDADWQPVDPRDSLTDVGTIGAANAPLVLARALAVQKSMQVAGDPVPGSTLQYTLAFQVSDYFAFDNVTISDTLSDGLVFVPGSAALTVTGGGVNVVNAPIAPTVTNNADGTTNLAFDVSAGIGAPLIGGCIDPLNGTANPDCAGFNAGALTQGTITFDVDIAQAFTTAPPGANINVDQGDRFSNRATITAESLDTTTFAPLGIPVSDNALDTFELDRGLPEKFIYAVNDIVCPACDNQVEPGDSVTYRFTYESPTSDFEDLVLTDFLPSPIFDVSDPDADSVAGPVWNSPPVPAPAPNTAPPPGVIWYSTTDTFSGLFPAVVPVVSADPASNTISVTYGDHTDPADQTSTIDLLFTIVATSDPFASGLTLANHISAGESSTNAGPARADAIAALEAGQPLLTVQKGVVAVDNPNAIFSPPTPSPVPIQAGGTPWTGTINSDGLDSVGVDSDVEGLDPGNDVTFAIVIENVGDGAAFDVTIRDRIPPGFTIPPGGINITVNNGNGNAVDYSGDLFGGGIELVDPGTGVCQGFDPANGENIVVIVYTLQVDGSVPVPTRLQNNAGLTRYANQDGGGNHIDSRETNAFSDRAEAVVGFRSDLTTQRGGEAFIEALGVETLPATGQSPLSRWRLPVFIVMGIVLVWLLERVAIRPKW